MCRGVVANLKPLRECVNREAEYHAEVKSKGKLPERVRGHLQRAINKTKAYYERTQDTMDSGHDGGFGGCLECSVVQSSKTKLYYQ